MSQHINFKKIGFPCVHLIPLSLTDFEEFVFSLRKELKNFTVVVLRGARMMTQENVFQEFASALQFPYYFGENNNALYDCLTDLSWLPAEGFILAITDSEKILSKEKEDYFVAFLDILKSACESWARSDHEDEVWGRPAKPFHLLIQHDKDTTVERFRSLQ